MSASDERFTWRQDPGPPSGTGVYWVMEPGGQGVAAGPLDAVEDAIRITRQWNGEWPAGAMR